MLNSKVHGRVTSVSAVNSANTEDVGVLKWKSASKWEESKTEDVTAEKSDLISVETRENENLLSLFPVTDHGQFSYN